MWGYTIGPGQKTNKQIGKSAMEREAIPFARPVAREAVTRKGKLETTGKKSVVPDFIPSRISPLVVTDLAGCSGVAGG